MKKLKIVQELLNSEKSEENWLIKLTDVDEEAYNALEEA